MRFCVLLAVLLAIAPARGFHSADAASGAVQIDFSPAQPLMDDVVHVTVRGLPSNALVTVRAQLIAPDGRRWQSHASFWADKNGVVDLSTQAPVNGTYDTVDPMGLSWSMAPDATQKQGSASFLTVRDVHTPLVTRLEVETNGRVIAGVDVPRCYLPSTVKTVEVHDSGLVARLYEPAACVQCAGVIVLGGSEGGYPDTDAAQFAARGYSALALAYFGLPGLPGELRNVPLEYVKRAIDWMRARSAIDARRIALIGGSRGSELALSAAARYSDVRAVVAMKPSHVVWEGLNAKGYPSGPPFTEGGKPLPYVPNHITLAFAWHYATARLRSTPPALTPMFLQNLRDTQAVNSAVIPVEKIKGPVLLVSGSDDQLWPSRLMAEKILARLKQNGHAFEDQHIGYEGVGHFIPTAYVPVAGSRRDLKFSIGGNPAATGRVCADAWPRILAFLRLALSIDR